MTEFNASHRSRILSNVLTPAVRLWLRSQVDRIEALHLHIDGGDRQLLGGYIPQVSVAAENAVYQGLHLSRVTLAGTNIRVNLGQVLRGKPLRLLEVVPVAGEAAITEMDLNASLRSPLLAQAISEFLGKLLQASDDLLDAPVNQLNFDQLHMKLGAEQFTLSANLISASGTPTAIAIRTGLRLVNHHELQLHQPQWLPHAQAKRGLPLTDLDGCPIDLGEDVNLQHFAIEPGQITCRGQINVIPID